MAGISYSGSFLKGLGEGLGTGFQIGQQAKEWKWQKAEKERIQKEKDDLAESVSIFNKKLESYYADGTLSDDEKLQLHTAYLGSAYNVQEVIKGSYDAIMKMDKDTLENNLNWLKFYRESLGDLDPSNIPQLYEYTKGQMIGEKGKQMFVAGDNLLKKQYEEKQKQKPVSFQSPEELLKVYPDSSYTYSADAGGYIPTFTKPTEIKTPGISDYNSAATYLSKFVNSPLDVFNKEKASIQNKFGIDVSNITQESLREPEKAVEKARITSLPQQEEYRTKALDTESWEEAQKVINDYTQAGYDETQLGITKDEWVADKGRYLTNILTAIKATTNEKGWLKNSEITPGEVGNQIEKNAPAPEVYELFRVEYMKYRDILEKAGIDVSQFPKLKPLSEIGKVGFLEGAKTFGGVGRGQYKSIYY